jgi:hypothetical protein
MNDWWIVGVTIMFAAVTWLFVLLVDSLQGDQR